MQKVNLDEWDQRIGPRLQDLEFSGESIARNSRIIQNCIGALPVRPAWESKAREALNNAEIELRMALAVVQTAQRAYDNLPVVT